MPVSPPVPRPLTPGHHAQVLLYPRQLPPLSNYPRVHDNRNQLRPRRRRKRRGVGVNGDCCLQDSVNLHRINDVFRYDNSKLTFNLSHLVGKPTMWFPNRSDTNRIVQAQKRARSLKFQLYVEEELYYPSSENKGADQLRGYREADLRLCFRLCRCRFSHEAAHLKDIDLL